MREMIIAALDANDIAYNIEEEYNIAVTSIDYLSATTIRQWREHMLDTMKTERLATRIASQLNTLIRYYHLLRCNQDDGITFSHYLKT